MGNPTQFRSPLKITDLSEFAGEYIELMSGQPDQKVTDRLIDYAFHFFRDMTLTDHQRRSLALMVVDRVYRYSAGIIQYDKKAGPTYFARVIRYLLDTLSSQGIRVFYILDNEIRFDRYVLLVELFMSAGIAVVSPYTVDAGPLSVDAVKHLLAVEVSAGRHIAYVEMDASVNYLSEVMRFACETDRLVVMRNVAPPDPSVRHLPSRGIPTL